MPRTPAPKDRFDDLPADLQRIGAHRAEQPRMRGSVVLLWSAVAAVVLIAVGIFGTLVATGRISLAPATSPGATSAPEVEPVVDTSFAVLVLNATPERGLAARVRDVVIAAGWAPEDVLDGEAGSNDFAATTVYFATAEDEGAARGLAAVVGATEIVLDPVYQPVDDPATEDVDESDVRQLAVVVGLDLTAAGAATTSG